MKKYRCKEPFSIGKVDDDGFPIEGEDIIIEKGEIFELNEIVHSVTGCEVHLDSLEKWIEITREYLEEYFELVEEKQ